MFVETLVNNVNPGDGGKLVSVGIQGGRFLHIGEHGHLMAKSTIDAGGQLLLPGLVEPHVHLDKTYTRDRETVAGTGADSALEQAIEVMASVKAKRSLDAVKLAARFAIERAISKGVCFMRSHIDVSRSGEMAHVEMLLELRDLYAGQIRLEFTALAAMESEEQFALATRALEAGVDCIGGAPGLRPDPKAAIDRVFSLAERFECPIDLHIDETEDPDSPCLEYLAERVLADKWSLPVSASHCCSLTFRKPEDRARVIDRVLESGIHIITLPACNLVLMGRGQVPAPRGAAPVGELLSAGVNVCAGSDNVCDPFHPWGDYDPLTTARINSQVAQIDDAETSVHMVAGAAAAAMGLQDYGFEVGMNADFSLLPVASRAQAVAESPLRSWVFFGGKPILRQRLKQDWLVSRKFKPVTGFP